MSTITFNEISQCGKSIFWVNINFIPLNILVLAGRIWSARYKGRRLQLDDYVVFFSFAISFTLASWALYSSLNGLGMHIVTLNLHQLTIQVQLLLVAEFLYLLGTASIKLSMLLLLHRIYVTPTFRRWCNVVIALDIIYVVTLIPLFLTNCIPLSQYWDPKPTGWCRDTLISDNTTVGFNLFLDLLVLALPLPVLWRLQMSIRDKLAVTSMFSIGIVSIALVLWRLGETLRTRESPDWTTSLCLVGFIASLELHLGILAVSIPTLAPVYNVFIKPVLNWLGIKKKTTETEERSLGVLQTIGGTGESSNKGSRAGYKGFGDSVDRIVSRDEFIKLTPVGESKVVVDCTFEPDGDSRTPGNIPGGIEVRRDIEAIYQPRKEE